MAVRALSWVNLGRIAFFHSLLPTGLWIGANGACLVLFGVVFYGMIFAVAAFNHRYFSHRAFKTSRAFQFVMAWLAAAGGQKGSLSWATSHRRHHRATDRKGDPHSPYPEGLFYAHLGWLLEKGALPTSPKETADFWRYPELRWLNRWYAVGPASLILILLGAGVLLPAELGLSISRLLYWGFLVPTLASVHVTCFTNSLAHGFWKGIGRQRYALPEASANLWWMFPLSLGENWHNNHHRFPSSASAGVKPWELDFIYLGIKLLALLGLVWDVRRPRA